MKKIIKIIGIGLLLYGNVAQAQVKYQLSLLPDKKTYMVSMVSSKTWAYPQNLTSTAQVTIKVPSDKPFTAVVTPLNPEVKWLDNAYIEKPESDPTHTYVSFGLASLGTSKLNYTENEEVPLFTFRNIEENACVGKISLLDNEKDALKGNDAETYNISNQISVFAAQGDVYAGNLRAEIDCEAVTGNQDLFGDVNIKAFPIPADNQVTIEWNKEANSATSETMLLKIEDAQGRLVLSKNVVTAQGKYQEQLNVSSYPSGYYHFYFIENNTNISKKYKFLIVK